ncbi:MAG: hypothetical protein NVS1B10_02290 [Candidatus Saccharimonadales bacterium]
MKFDIATPYCAVFIIFRKGTKVAFVLRQNTTWQDGFYGLIAGKVEHNETFLSAAIREAKEEAGVSLKPENLEHQLTVYRRSSDSDWIDVIFEARDWPGELYNAEPKVHASLDWLDLDNLPENTIDVLHFYFEQIKAGNKFAEHGW